MNPDVKDKWLAALRSGKYRQGKYYLRWKDGDSPDEFCCMGVLCDVAVQDGLDVPVEPLDRGGYIKSTTYFYANESGVLPQVVREWAGLDESNPAVLGATWDPDKAQMVPGTAFPSGVEYHLAELNDDLDLTFEQIADVIERYL